MARQTNPQRSSPLRPPLEQIQDESNVVYALTTQLEALARVLTQVRDADKSASVTPDDFVHIMHLFAQQLASMKDLAGGIEGSAEAAVKLHAI